MLKGTKAPATAHWDDYNFREAVINGPIPTKIVELRCPKNSAVEEMETICFWCDLPITIRIYETQSRPVPICCSRCKNYFWF